MNNISIQLYPNQTADKPMRDILGMNNSPTINRKDGTDFEKPRFDALNLGYVRFHDAPAENPGQMIIDIHRIFPLFYLDETDQRNYFFAQTDDYLRVIADGRAEIDFRLGETIDHSGNGRLVAAPEDPDKWARICRNIIGHYKNGEMDSMRLNITRVTVWEEPDNPRLFGGTVQQYSEMFCKVYKLLKKDFPDIQVGGPNCMGAHLDWVKEFLDICKQNGIQPDYIISTVYTRDVSVMLQVLRDYRALLDSYGCCDTKCSYSEWHLAPPEWDNVKTTTASENGFRTAQNAAFSVAALIGMMDVDYLDTAYYYAWKIGRWSVMDNFSTTGKRMLPVYYGLLFFQKLATECTERVSFQIASHDGVWALAGKTKDGKTRLLIACYDNQPCTFTCNTENVSACTLYSVNEEYHEEEAIEGVALPVENGTVTFTHKGNQGVYLLEF